MFITNEAIENNDFYELLNEKLQNGVEYIILDRKDVSEIEYIKFARKIKTIISPFKTKLIIYNRINVVFAVNADGILISENFMELRDARRIVRKDYGKLVGALTNSKFYAKEAEAKGIDFIVTTNFELINLVNIPVIKKEALL